MLHAAAVHVVEFTFGGLALSAYGRAGVLDLHVPALRFERLGNVQPDFREELHLLGVREGHARADSPEVEKPRDGVETCRADHAVAALVVGDALYGLEQIKEVKLEAVFDGDGVKVGVEPAPFAGNLPILEKLELAGGRGEVRIAVVAIGDQRVIVLVVVAGYGKPFALLECEGEPSVRLFKN